MYDPQMGPEPTEAEVPTKADLGASIATRVGTITVAELHRRCAVLEPGIVLYHEIPDGTAETFEVMLERVYELGAQFERFAIVIDMTESTTRPRGRHFELILRALKRGAIHHAGVQPGRELLRQVNNFIMKRINRDISLHGSRAEALQAAQTALARRQA
jgi:hypothetical protein